ncbi:hypothetical protein K458DRAFT_389332 [Lentithecium fluviatile CBS 122367]|uniref:Metalloendopeptidase n=1 Tax=Lentithecium fluviatile CBS 122367 TaxID=1168545 RepID=A0A6G1J149_9PLEO|nr:hypothetical protein K458DRAFT_389332 [Lentithecium fluviatile CBS 122367]
MRFSVTTLALGFLSASALITTARMAALSIDRYDSETDVLTSAHALNATLSLMTLGVFEITFNYDFGHVLGLQHEHPRPDRDNYIKVLYENADDAYIYGKGSDKDTSRDWKSPYDVKSIMHYRQDAGRRKSEEKYLPVMQSKDENGNVEKDEKNRVPKNNVEYRSKGDFSAVCGIYKNECKKAKGRG